MKICEFFNERYQALRCEVSNKIQEIVKENAGRFEFDEDDPAIVAWDGDEPVYAYLLFIEIDGVCYLSTDDGDVDINAYGFERLMDILEAIYRTQKNHKTMKTKIEVIIRIPFLYDAEELQEKCKAETQDGLLDYAKSIAQEELLELDLTNAEYSIETRLEKQ